MAFITVKRTGHWINNQNEYMCDTSADIASLPTLSSDPPAEFGSRAYVISDGGTWILNSQGVWKKQPIGGEEVGIVTIESVETDEYLASYQVYQGETLVGYINVPFPTIEDGSIEEAKLSSAVQRILEATVASEDGAHGVRYYDNNLEYEDENHDWNVMELDGFKL